MNTTNSNYRAVPFGWKRETALAATALAAPKIVGTHGYKRRAVALLAGALALFGMLVGATQSYAQPIAHVQGRIISNGYYGPSPVGGVMLTLFNWQVGRTTRSISRPDGTFYFKNIPLGWYNVEVWLPNSQYPRTYRVVVNQMPVSNIGTIQLDMPMGMQVPQGVGGMPGQVGWVQTGY